MNWGASTLAREAMREFKFLICGPHQSGKTTFMSNVVETFRPRQDFPETDYEPAQTADEFGTTESAPGLKYLFYSSPSPRRFDFLWEVYAENCSGYVFIVDSTQPETFLEVRYALEHLLNYRSVPFIVAANKQDLPDAFTHDLIANALHLDSSANVIPCIAIRKPSAQTAFEVLLKRVTI